MRRKDERWKKKGENEEEKWMRGKEGETKLTINVPVYMARDVIIFMRANPFWAHCKENPIYVFLFWELRGLSPNFHVYMSVSDLYNPGIGPHISLQQNRQTDPGNI